MTKKQASLTLLGLLSLSAVFFAVTRLRPAFFPNIKAPAPRESSESVSYSTPQVRLSDELHRRFANYVAHRSRHNLVLLEEIIFACLRVDAAGCLSQLESLHAMSLLSSPSLGGAVVQVAGENFEGVLKIAAELEGRTADKLVSDAFRHLIESDPVRAFESLRFLPRHLLPLSAELAKSWTVRDAYAAADAFSSYAKTYGETGLLSFVLRTWGEMNPDAAFDYLSALKMAVGLKRDVLQQEFFSSLSETNPEAVTRLLAKHNEVPRFARPSFAFAFASLHDEDPQKALDASTSLPAALQQPILESYTGLWSERGNPEITFQAATRLPVSESSLESLRKAAAKLVSKGDDADARLNILSDPYQRTAAISGMCEGLWQSKGADGLAEAVRHGISSNDLAWLEATVSLLASSEMPKGRKTMPPDALRALLDFADTHLSSEGAAALRARLK